MNNPNKSLEKQRAESRRVQEEQDRRAEHFKLESKRKAKTKKKVIAVVVSVLVLFSAFLVYAFVAPGEYDDFAKCLTEKGAKMYGEDWCQYTQGQKTMFGKSFKYIDYEVKENLEVRPTWVIDGETYGKVQSFQRLSALTGCEY